MAYYPNAIVVAESSDESPGSDSPADTSPDDMQAFYDDVERREILERKLSKRKSNSGTSMWSRGSSKRPTVPAPAHATTSEFPRIPSKNDMREKDARGEAKPERERVKRNSSHQLTSSRSVTADRDNLTWTAKGAWPDVPLATIKIKYPLHNPMGPRWYRNHHLIPPSQKRPSMRPPTFFSPSFPPIHTSSSPGHILDDSEGHDGTPAHSPQPTPTSSQTRVAEGGKRSRKTSQTTPDNVDLLDVTDPWGQSWHHRSPYDFDFGNTPDSHDVPNRTRRASMTATQNKHQSVTPSPLSQSASAVHLPPPQSQIHIPRKLSKRRTPTADAVFKDQPTLVDHRKAASAPPTPTEPLHVMTPADVQPSDSNFLPKRMSVAPPPAHLAMYQTPKKEKRGSMLNRLAKKFSILRKSTDDHVAGKEYWHHMDDQEIRGYNLNGQSSNFGRGPSSPEKSRPESVRRVPPPSEHVPNPTPAPAPLPVESKRDADRASVSSLETRYSMGRLTVANPDLPDSEKETQDLEGVPVPRENPPHVERPVDSNIPVVESSYFPHISQLSTIDARSRFDKPLPPPQLATPRFSELGLAMPETPEVVEQPLPPPPPPSQKPSPNRNHTKSPPAQGPQEHTKATPGQPQTASSSSPNVPPQSNTSGIALPPAPTQVTHETPKRSSSQVKPPITKELPLSPETTPDRSRTQSPPMPQSFAQYEAPKKSKVQVQPSSLSRDLIMSPEPANLSRNLGHERAATQPSSSATRERLPEVSSSKRRDSKQIRHQSRSEDAPALPPVPFPTTAEHPLPVPVPEDPESYNRYDASPLSTSSVLANPPTPYDYRQSIVLTPDQSAPPSLPPKSIYEGKTSHNHNPSPIRTSAINPSPSNPSPSRQTETFKLVRSSSGNVYASGQTITAQGQQWEVVESVESKGRKEKTSSRGRDQEYRSREHEHKAKEPEPKSKDHERRSRDYEPRSRDTDYEQRSREHEYRSKEPDRKSTYRSKDSERARDNEKSKDYELPKDYVRLKDNERSRTKDYELPKDYERTKDHGRSREHEKSKEYEKSREYERSRDHEQSRDGHRREHERPRDPEQSRSSHRPKDADRSKDYTRSRDYEPRSKEYEQSSHRDSKKDSRPPPKTEVISNADHHRSSNRLSKPAAPYPGESSKVRSNGKSSFRLEEPSSRSSRHRDEHRERKPEHISAEVPFPSNHHVTRLQAVPVQPPNPAPAPVRLERNPSLTARPTSELPSAAEMNAIRAKESWDMERLWKARSMYGLEPNAPTTNFIHGPGSSSSRSDDAHTQSAVYGSSHTAYVVQSPFQGSEHRSQIYHSMPIAPPPIIYSSPAYIPSIPDSISSYDPDEHVFRTYHTPQANYQASAMDYRASPSSLPRPPLSNPLPEPPRESPFDPTKSTVRSSKRHSNDYWTKYNGITTAH